MRVLVLTARIFRKVSPCVREWSEGSEGTEWSEDIPLLGHPFAGIPLFLSPCCEKPGSAQDWAHVDAKSGACLREAQRMADGALRTGCSAAVGVGLRSCFLSWLTFRAAVPVMVPGRAIPRMLVLPRVPSALLQTPTPRSHSRKGLTGPQSLVTMRVESIFQDSPLV